MPSVLQGLARLARGESRNTRASEGTRARVQDAEGFE